MSSIFISHSSKNNREAMAIRHWLTNNGWDDVFLDVDTEKGIHPGKQWKNALSAAADRCQAVMCLVSKDWMASPECKVEYRYAEYLDKQVFPVFIEPCEESDFTSSWQRCILYGPGKKETISLEIEDAVVKIEFLAEGLSRLRNGLKDAGLDADYFNYDINRSPYPGFRPLEFEDASIFFGRDASVIRALDTLRSLRKRDIEPLLIILGASGAGKSSFLRAGLLPRLARDDRNFLTLPIVRPERAAISGKNGLVSCIEQAFHNIKQDKNRSDIRKKLDLPSGFRSLLMELQIQAGSGLNANAENYPSIIFPIDQAEELFGLDNPDEAKQFIELFTNILTPVTEPEDPNKHFPRPLALITIRSESYQRWQNEAKLGLVTPYLFSLPPIAREEYKLIIEEPAKRRSAAGRKLLIKPALTEKLLKDTEGADALPLLAFTLERLLLEHGADGLLSMDDYELLGGVGGSIEAAIETAFADPNNEPQIPTDKTQREHSLRQAFIPWLAWIDPDTEERKRRVARWDDIPLEAQPLLERLIRQRLLVRDYRRIAGDSVDTVVVEVAHEALLRRWPTLTGWLDQDASAILTLSAANRSAKDWKKNGHRNSWLVHSDECLSAVETLLQRKEFNTVLEELGRAYIRACRKREDAIKAEEIAQQQKEQELERKRIEAEQLAKRERFKLAETEAKQAAERAESSRRLFKRTAMGAIAASLFGIGAVVFAIKANQQQTAAENALSASNVMEAKRRYEDGQKGQALAYLAKAVRLAPGDKAWRATLSGILLGNGWCPQKAVLKGREPTTEAYFSPDASKVVTLAGDEALIWDAANGKRIGSALRHRNTVNSALFNPDGSLIVTASTDRYVRVWDSNTGIAKLDLARHPSAVLLASFTADGQRIVTKTANEMRVFNASTGEEMGSPIAVEFSKKIHFLFRIKDKTVRYWNAEKGSQVGPDMANIGQIKSGLFSADGRQLAIETQEGLQVINLDTGQDALPLIDIAGLTPKAFSADASKLLFGDSNLNLALLDINTRALGKKKAYPASHADYEQALSPDGTRLSVRGKGGPDNDKVYLFDTSTWKSIGKPIENAHLSLPQYCHDGTRSISVADKFIYLQDAFSGELLIQADMLSSPIKSTGFSQDCRLIYAVAGPEARIWDARTGHPIGQSLAHPAAIVSASFSPDGTRLMTVTSLGAHLWESKAGAATGEVVQYAQDADIALISAAGNRILTVNGTHMRLWDTQSGAPIAKETALVDNNVEWKYSLLNHNGTRALFIEDNYLAQVWSTEKGLALARSFSVPTDTSIDPILSSSGRYMLSVSERIARVWDLNSGKPLKKSLRHNGLISSAVFSDDDNYLVTTSDDSTAKVWRVASGEPVGQAMYHDGYKVSSASFDKNGSRLLTVSMKAIPRPGGYPYYEARTLRVWITNTGRPLSEPISYEEKISSASLSPDGKFILVSTGNRSQILDVSSTKPIGEPLTHDADVTSARFSSDGTRILTTSGQNAILWDAQRSTRIGEPLMTPEPLNDAYFLPDEQSIVTLSGQQESDFGYQTDKPIIRLWDIPTGNAKDGPLLASVAEAISGYSVSEFGTLSAIQDPLTRLTTLLNSLKTGKTESSSVQAMVLWLLSDAWERTIAPSADLTVSEYLENSFKDTSQAKAADTNDASNGDSPLTNSGDMDRAKALAATLYPGLSSIQQQHSQHSSENNGTK